MGVGVGTGVGGRDGVSVGGGTLGVFVGMGVSVAAGAGVKVGLGVLVGVGSDVGAPAINEVSGHPRHPNALPKTNTAMRITNRDLLIIFILFSFSSQTVWSTPSTSAKRSTGDFRPVLYHTLREIQRLR